MQFSNRIVRSALIILSLISLPKVCCAQPSPSTLHTLWLIGDSTVHNGNGTGAGGMWGWGEPLVQFFDKDKIRIINRAIGGRSSRTFFNEGRWDQVLKEMQSGDILIMQFGHNDPAPYDDVKPRGSLPGIGEESKEFDNPVLGHHETVHTYGWYLRHYIRDAKAKGVVVIVCSPIPRKIWQNNHIVRSGVDSYSGWARQVATQEYALFLDLNEIIAREYDLLGKDAVNPLFADPHTHTSAAGSLLNAKAVITGLKMLHPDPLEPYMSGAADRIPGYMAPLQ